jgi:hypothetical protein
MQLIEGAHMIDVGVRQEQANDGLIELLCGLDDALPHFAAEGPCLKAGG